MIKVGIIVNVSKENFLEAWFPRGLVRNGNDVLSAQVSVEGLCPLRIAWDKGKIISIQVIESKSALPSKFLLPRLVEPHSHIDKAFTWNKFPNLKATYEGALEVNLEEYKVRTVEDVRSRSERALNIALRSGLRAIRTHVDSFGLSGHQNLETLLELKREWESFIHLQCVALVPLEYWDTGEGRLLASRVASAGGLLGGVIAPPFDNNESFLNLLKLVQLASQLNCGIDLHIDESDRYPGYGIKKLIQVLRHTDVRVPITCSHSSSMGLLRPGELCRLADQISHYGVNVIALPLTNSWLLGRYSNKTPITRPIAPIRQLQKAGVIVAVGGDNVQDPWFPLGRLDPIELISLSMPITQLAPWYRLGLAPFTTSAAAVMGMQWDGTIGVGSPADFVVIDASSWTEALTTKTKRQILLSGKWLEKNEF